MNFRKPVVFAVFAFAFALGATSCSKREANSVITDHKATPDGERDSARGPKVPAIKEVITFNRTAVLETEFFYSADLQYSSQRDERLDLFSQAMVLGLIPAKFRIWENELQLMAQDERLYSSHANHPNQIISRYKIVSEDQNTLTVTAADSGVYLSQLMQSASAYKSPEALQPRDSFIRSFEFVSGQNLILQETTLRLADGARYDVLEALFPKSALAMGADFKTFVMDPEDPVGAKEGDVARFRFLPGEKIFQNGEATSYAAHFDISKKADGTDGTIDWWVTRNIPDEYLKPVQLAIEGFNRYFLGFKGINRAVVQFKGKLPEGVKLGDPRFNVIAWDDITFAGAAYESQGSDPFTGKQSHSLIYMPAAWLNIGEKFWKDGQYSEKSKMNEGWASGQLRTSKRIACAREMESYSAALVDSFLSGKSLSSDSEKQFGIELLKGVIHHEVGHALGLAHNFKGSLSLNRGNANSRFSDSIMDYNDFQYEKEVFNGVDSADGPQLAYDRQALSAIYNAGKDISETDPKLSACNDAEADEEEGGVDPLCIRYDLENDPTLSVSTAFSRISNLESNRKGESTLAQALKKISTLLMTETEMKKLETDAAVKEAVAKYNGATTAAMRFYFTSGTGSIQRTVRTNIKSLYAFKDEVLPALYNEREMRERAYSGVTQAIGLFSFPTVVKSAIRTSQDNALSALVGWAPYIQKMVPPATRDSYVEKLRENMNKSASQYESGSEGGLTGLRTTILKSLVRKAKVPYYFGKLNDSKYDFETALVRDLAKIIKDQETRQDSERLAAANAFSTYKGRGDHDRLIRDVIDEITDQRDSSIDNASREAAEKLLAALKK